MPIGAVGLLLAACLLTTPAVAQTAGNEGLSPTLANIKKTHVVRLGYRESSPPFSFLDHQPTDRLQPRIVRGYRRESGSGR
jgi:glutamate/aspartate transport system substrate-binding protein